MMQEDSNGESTFEFVDKKSSDSGLSKNDSLNSMSSASLIPSGGNLLSSLAPPSALPSFVAAPTTDGQVVSQPPIATSTTLTPSHAFHPTSFSPVIPPSKEGDTTPVTAVEEASPVGDMPSSLFGWVKGAVGTSGGIFSRVAEKAKSSVDSMITTLDPQMREFLHSGGDIDIIVASEKEVKVSPIREAFQAIFGKATVSGVSVVSVGAAQPVGYASGVRAAEQRILAVRATSKLYQRHPVLAIENFIIEMEEDKWYDLGVLVLSDPSRGINLQTLTQLTPVPASIVGLAKEDTPSDYPHLSSGYSVPIGSLMASNLHVHHSEWHEAYTGVPRRDMLLLAAKALAGIYKTSIASSIL